jgi:hypothetical protein
MISAMFGNQDEDVLVLFSGTPWGQFCSEGRKHSIVNSQSFGKNWGFRGLSMGSLND